MRIDKKEARYLHECLKLLYRHVDVEDVWTDSEDDWEWMRKLEDRLQKAGEQ